MQTVPRVAAKRGNPGLYEGTASRYGCQNLDWFRAFFSLWS